MSVDRSPTANPAVIAGRAQARAEARLINAVADHSLSADGRLDDRTRLMLGDVLSGMVTAIAQALGGEVRRQRNGDGQPPPSSGVVYDRLHEAGVLRDPDLLAELIARVAQDLLAGSLGENADGGERQSLLLRLSGAPEPAVVAAAGALMAAENRRRAANDGGVPSSSDLPVELHRRLVWWVAAAMRGTGDAPDADRSIAEAASAVIGAYDEDARPEPLAMRLALAIDATPGELAPLLVEALADGLLTLFVALVAQALGMSYDQARTMTLEPEGDRLWLAMRALLLDRRAIAQIALLLADADPRRDIEAFADALDAIAAVDPGEAAAALAPMALPADFRAAIRALAGAGGR